MTTPIQLSRTLLITPLLLWACQGDAGPDTGGPSLTIYNQHFGVVREQVPLQIQSGVNRVTFSGITAHLEPDSVVLRDPAGKRQLTILEQSYRGDPLSEGLLLSLYEGETIPFLIETDDGETRTVDGKIIRSGYQPATVSSRHLGHDFYQRQRSRQQNGSTPIIEVDGALRFGLPGTPLFPSLKDDTVLKPTLNWVLRADQGGSFNAELSYVTGGMTWEADYNIIAPEQGDVVDIVGWITMENQSGRRFDNARIKLMAGDIHKLQDGQRESDGVRMALHEVAPAAPPVTEKSFDEFHLYTLTHTTTLRDSETKQVEFIRAEGVESRRVYVYRGADIDWRRYRGWDPERIRNDQGFGTDSNKKIWILREFKNSDANQLGLPLPKGRTRFYRSDSETNTLEFVGENEIDHTPKNELVKVYTGNAFDIVGERKRKQHQLNHAQQWLEEAFEITLRNHKDSDVTVRVIEDLYRWPSWEMQKKSHDFEKIDAQTIRFDVPVPADGEAVVRYSVRYSW